MGDKKFTRKEIAELNSKTDNVFIIDNVVYDVTEFLEEHPGGHEILVSLSGKDVSEDFKDMAHSSIAIELTKTFVVGELIEEDKVEAQKREIRWIDTQTHDEESFVSSWIFPLLLGVVIFTLYTSLFG